MEICNYACLPKRQILLLGSACVRHAVGPINDERFSSLLHLTEEYIEGRITDNYLDKIRVKVRDSLGQSYYSLLHSLSTNAEAAIWVLSCVDEKNMFWILHCCRVAYAKRQHGQNYPAARRQEEAAQDEILDDFLPPKPVGQVLRNQLILSLAQVAYEQRVGYNKTFLDGARLAVLADALEDAGCTDKTVLDHLRGTSPHVRGCWVLEAILRQP